VSRHRYRSVRYYPRPDATWARFEPWMTTLVDLDTGRVPGVVDGRDSTGVVTLAVGGGEYVPGHESGYLARSVTMTAMSSGPSADAGSRAPHRGARRDRSSWCWAGVPLIAAPGAFR